MGRSLFFYIFISCLFSLSFGLENDHSLSGVIEQHVDENNHEDEEYHHGRRGLRGYVVTQISVPLPESLGTLADTTSSIQRTDIPVYWHVLKSGGTTMKHVFCQCLNMVAATENGVSGHAGQTQVSVMFNTTICYFYSFTVRCVNTLFFAANAITFIPNTHFLFLLLAGTTNCL